MQNHHIIFFSSQLVIKVTQGANATTKKAGHAMTCLSWSRCSCGTWWACSPGSSRPGQWRPHAGCYHDWRWPAREQVEEDKVGTMPLQLASWSMRGGFEPLCYLHNLLVLCGRDKVSEDLLDNVLAFCCLWHHKRWSLITSASWGQHRDVQSNTVTVTYWLTWFFKLNLRCTDKIVKWLLLQLLLTQ